MFEFLKNEDAPTFAEYALLITLIAFVAAIGVGIFGGAVAALFDVAESSIPGSP